MIYFFLRRSDGRIKIGTTKDYHSRRYSLATQYGQIELLGLMEGDRKREQELHQQFAQYRVARTEFFEDHDALREFITQNTGLPVPVNEATSIGISEETRDALRDFTRGLGTTYDAALSFLLSLLAEDGETALMAGYRLRSDCRDLIER
jgi:hypothetical protein